MSIPPAIRALACALAVLSGCSTEPLPAPEGWERGPARLLRTLKAEGPLLAGAARVPLHPPFSVPMGGYFGGSELLLREQRDPLYARALVLEAGGLRVGVVSLDLVLIPPDLRAAVEETADFRESGVAAWTICATHDHKSLGGFARAWPAQRFGVGSYDPLIFRFIVKRSAMALAQASRSLRPSAPSAGSASPPPEAPPLVYNRKVPGTPVDHTVRALGLWRSDAASPQPADAKPPAPSITLVNFAAHPTVIPAGVRSASADFPGVICRALEAGGGSTLFLNGACGDLAGGIHREEARAWWERRVEWIGRRLEALARQALEAAAGARETAGPRETIGPPETAGARAGSTLLAYAEGEILLPPRNPWRVPFIGRAISSNYPDRVNARAIRLGDVVLLFFPGELGSDLGAQIRRDLLASPAAAPARDVWVVCLADDYLGYIFSREQYRAGGMSQHLTVYGDVVGDVLRARLVEIGRAVL